VLDFAGVSQPTLRNRPPAILRVSGLILKEIRKKYVRENKAIAIDPVWVLGVERHELVEHNVSHRGHAHRGARVARVGLECGIDLQNLTY
jgi:hypothetical protein